MIGERLRAARNERGWTLEALAIQTGIPVSSLSEFETGKREPRLTHLEALACTHGKSVSWFFENSSTCADVVLWRRKPETSEAASIEGRFIQHCRWYRNLEEWCDDRRPSLLPECTDDPNRFTWPDAHRLATQVRKALDLGQQPASSLLSVLENACGVRVFHFEFEPTGTAACTRSDQMGMAILLNAKNKRWRRNYDLAHELFHLLTWKAFRSSSGASVASDREEQFADAFASSLLIPDEPLRDAVAASSKSGGSLKHIEIFDIARQFDVSYEALLWRMHNVFRRTREDTERDIKVCHALRDTAETREDTKPPCLPERYRSLAIRALQAGELSIGRAAEYLGLSRKAAMALDELKEVTDDAISLGSS